MTEGLIVEDRARIRVLTLNRPEARNSIDDALAAAIGRSLSDFDGDETLRVGVITGTAPGFSAGMDLKAFAAGQRGQVPGRGFAGLARHPPRKPLVAAIEGFALAGGLEIALACDLIVAARDARLGLPEPRLGIVAAAGGLLRLPARIPYHVATEMLLTGRTIDGARAADLGLVTRATDPGTALDEAMALAGEIAQNGPTAIEISKQILALASVWPTEEVWRRHDALAAAALESDEAREGAEAFAQRRVPAWRVTKEWN